jgi:hypothetical protein
LEEKIIQAGFNHTIGKGNTYLIDGISLIGKVLLCRRNASMFTESDVDTLNRLLDDVLELAKKYKG